MFPKMQSLISIFLPVLCFHLVATHSHELSDHKPKDKSGDAVTNLLSDLEQIALNVDKAASRIPSPLSELEKTLEQLRKRNQNMREELFERLRNNYGDLRKRMDQPLKVPENVGMSSSFFGMNLQNNEGRSSLDLSIPFLPMKLSVSSKVEPSKVRKPLQSHTEGVTSPMPSPEPVTTSPESVEPMKQDAVEEIVAEQISHLKPEQVVLDVLPTDDSQNEYSRRQGDGFDVTTETDDAESRGRILGEVLYSEKMFDKITRQVLKDHGKWALDSTIVNPKVKNQVNKAVNEVMEKSERVRKTSKSPQRKPSRPDQQTYYDVNHQSNSNERFDFELQDQSFRRQRGELPRQETVVLAFTPEGVPLKLKMSAEIPSPLRYLHEILTASGVSLKVPVDNGINIQPAGTDIIELGYGYDGMMLHAISVDLSDLSQLDSLLKTLRKFKK